MHASNFSGQIAAWHTGVNGTQLWSMLQHSFPWVATTHQKHEIHIRIHIRQSYVLFAGLAHWYKWYTAVEHAANLVYVGGYN